MSSSEDEQYTLDESVAVAGTSRSAIDERALRDVHFVSLVRGYEELYLRAHPRYKDRRRRRAVWQEIATIVDQPVEDCKKRWKRMRTKYWKAVQRARRYGHAGEQRPAYEKLMSFLDETFLSKERLKSILARTGQHADRDDQEAEGSDADSSSEDEPVTATAAPRQQDQSDPPEDDEDVNFFVQLAESMADFPEAVRIHVKREAFRIVTDAEEMLYHSKLRGDLGVVESEHME